MNLHFDKKYLKFTDKLEGQFAETTKVLSAYRSDLGFDYPNYQIVWARTVGTYKDNGVFGRPHIYLISFEKHGILFIGLETVNQPSVWANLSGRDANLVKNCIKNWNYFIPNQAIIDVSLKTYRGHLFGPHKLFSLTLGHHQNYQFLIKKRSLCELFNQKSFDDLGQIVKNYVD